MLHITKTWYENAGQRTLCRLSFVFLYFFYISFYYIYIILPSVQFGKIDFVKIYTLAQKWNSYKFHFVFSGLKLNQPATKLAIQNSKKRTQPNNKQTNQKQNKKSNKPKLRSYEHFTIVRECCSVYTTISKAHSLSDRQMETTCKAKLEFLHFNSHGN